LINFKIISRKIDSIKVIISGRLCWLRYQKAGYKDIIVNDSKGAIYEGREDLKDYDGEGKDAEDDTNSGNTSNYEISRKSKPDPEILPPRCTESRHENCS
jgi:malic enzyme